jgi:CzcA family heavy metal efflux pump
MFAAWDVVQRARKPLLFLVAALAALGVWAYLTAPQSIFPQISLSRVEVFASAGDLPPEEVRSQVTHPLEAALQSLSIHEIRTLSNQGAAELELDFDSSTDPRVNLQNVEGVIASVRPTLPAVTNIVTVIQHPNMEPAVQFGVTATSVSQAQLRHLVEQQVVPVFTGIRGLGRITIFAGPDLEYNVDLDPKAVAAAGLTAGDVVRTLGEANGVSAAGVIDRDDQRSVVFAGEALNDEKTLGNVAVFDRQASRFVPLNSLAKIAVGDVETSRQASFGGVPAVIMSAYPIIGADTVSLEREIEARIPQLASVLPADAHITKYWDQTRLIVASQNSLRDSILLGAFLALVIIYIFLRSVGMTLVAGAIIPVAMAMTILVIERAGMSLNLMSIGGLAIAVGLIIDEVIVVIESIARELAQSPKTERGPAIMRATGRIARPLIASTAANVVVFLPLILLTGIPGFFFRALAITLGTALIISIFLSLVVAPILTDKFLRSRRAHRPGLVSLEPWYARILGWALKHRPAVYVGAVAVLAATVLLFTQLESDFLPGLEEGEFEIIYALPAGTSLAATDRIVRGFEQTILADPAVDLVGRLTGVDTDGYELTPQSAGTIRISLKKSATDEFEQVSDRMRDAMTKAAPGASFEFHQLLEDQLNDLSGAPEAIQLSVIGPDQEKLIAIADRLTDEIGKIPGVVDAFNGVVDGNQTVRVSPNSNGANGMTLNQLSDGLGAAIGGIVATSVNYDGSAIPVRVRLAGNAPDVALDQLAIPVGGALSPLGSVATIGKPTGVSEVFERNGARMLLVTAGIEDASLSEVIPLVQQAVAAVPMPPGYHVELGGAYKAQQASFREFATVLSIAVILVFFVLLATFNSFRLPLVILATIPLAPIGVVLALWLTDTSINVSSFMGLLLLVGIVVRNGILLMDAANRRRNEGATVHEALIGAGVERLRPILMTAFAAIGALLPLALGIGTGSEMERPLAIAVIGGLLTSTAFTLVMIPVLYAGFSKRPALSVVKAA